ncbi:MAG: carbohydrate kinase [Bacteroidetes bacterium]|nr:MAG: carbohydrate kinase [Bacteroidota bacterium]
MRKVYAIGESLIDIIFSQGDVKAARPGGSMLNSSISLGRVGTETIFISEFGTDLGGGYLADFLEKNRVKTHHIHRYTKGKTAIALAFLNEKGDASYDFYKSYPEDRLKLTLPEFTPDDILLFGSFFGIDPAIRKKVLKVVKAAKKGGAMIVYDPNIRKPHAHQLEKLRPYILENMNLADIVRGSDEDMEIIFGESSVKKLSQIPQLLNKLLIITRSATVVFLESPLHSASYPVPEIEVVSTIGAGDNFNAGLIYGLIRQDVVRETLNNTSPEQWEKIIGYATAFASEVCMSYDNYISTEFARNCC